MPLLFLDGKFGIRYYFHMRNSNVSLREILTSIAFLLLAVCAVLGVAGMFLPWTEAAYYFVGLRGKAGREQ